MRVASSGLVVPAMGLAGDGAGEASGMLELGKECSGTEEGQMAVVGVFARGGVPGVDSMTTGGMGEETKWEREKKTDRERTQERQRQWTLFIKGTNNQI